MKKRMTSQRFTFSAPRELLDEVRRYAKKDKTRSATVMRRALRHFLQMVKG